MNQILNLNYFIEYKEFTKRFKLIRKYKDSVLGDATLYKDTLHNKTVIIKEKVITTKEDFDKEFKEYDLLNKLNDNGNITKFLYLTYKLNQNQINNTWVFYAIREYIEHDLDREIHIKLRNKVNSCF